MADHPYNFFFLFSDTIPKKKVIIIGAGPAGLSTAYELNKSDDFPLYRGSMLEFDNSPKKKI